MTTFQLIIGGTSKRSKFQREVSFDLPETSVDFITKYGLKQYLADKTAGAKTADDFNAGIDEGLRRIAESDFTRAKGEGNGLGQPDTAERRFAKLVRTFINSKVKAAGLKFTAEQLAAAVSAFMDGGSADAESMKAEAARQVTNEAKMRDATDGTDLLKSLGLTQ